MGSRDFSSSAWSLPSSSFWHTQNPSLNSSKAQPRSYFKKAKTNGSHSKSDKNNLFAIVFGSLLGGITLVGITVGIASLISRRRGPKLNLKGKKSQTQIATSISPGNSATQINALLPFSLEKTRITDSRCRYFAYGSNMSKEQLKTRCSEFNQLSPGKQSHKTATAKDFKLDFVFHNNTGSITWGGGGVATISEEAGGETEGLIYALPESDIKALDRSEGAHYKKINLQVQQNDGSLVECFTYIRRNPETDLPLKPSQSYIQHIKNAAAPLSQVYKRTLQAVEAQSL